MQRRVVHLQVLLIYLLTDISARPVVGVSGSVIFSPSLLDSVVDQESFQGTGELRFFMEYLAHQSNAL